MSSAIDARYVEPKWIDVSHPVVPIRGLPAAWDGATIAHWCDLHSAYLLDLEYLEKAVRLSNAQKPDLVVMCGDIINHDEPKNTQFIGILGDLTARDGKFACPGNHDHPAAFPAVMAACGFATLANGHRVLNRPGGRLCIAGVQDLWQGRPNVPVALEGMDEDIPRVLLSHNPDVAEMLPASPRVDLMLCGHTHGGQVRLPLLGSLSAAIKHRQYTSGLAQGPRCAVYTSRGLGMGVMAIRFNCRPELPIITLRRV